MLTITFSYKVSLLQGYALGLASRERLRNSPENGLIFETKGWNVNIELELGFGIRNNVNI